MSTLFRAVVLFASVGCAARPVSTPADSLSYAFEARPTWGEVRVVPALALHDPVHVNLDSYLGRALPPHRRQVRAERAADLQRLPTALGLALPGEVNGLLGLDWQGQFRGHDLPPTLQVRLGDAITGRRPDLHASLADAARTIGGEATLFSWVVDLEAEPLSLRGFPGEVVDTEVGPVVLDHNDEPYLVRAEIGMALVAHDGEVVLRYQDDYATVLSGHGGTAAAARRLAHALAEEVVMVWAVDPRLGRPPKGPSRGGRLRTFHDPVAALP